MRTLFASLALCVVSFILGVVGDLARPEQPRPQPPRGARVVVAIPPAPLALSEAQAATTVNVNRR